MYPYCIHRAYHFEHTSQFVPLNKKFIPQNRLEPVISSGEGLNKMGKYENIMQTQMLLKIGSEKGRLIVEDTYCLARFLSR